MSAVDIRSIAGISQVFEQNWSLPGAGLGPLTYHLNQSVQSFSVLPTGSAQLWDYHYVELQGVARLQIDPSGPTRGWALQGFLINLHNPTPGTDLIQGSPNTTNSATSYTTGISTTIGGSVGFMGDQPTASFSASMSISSSRTTSVSALSVIDQSMADTGSWLFVVAPNSSMADGNAPIDVAALFRTPHGTSESSWQLLVRTYLSHDRSPDAATKVLTDAGFNVGSAAPGWGFYGADLPGLDNRGGKLCSLDFSQTIVIPAPPAPPAHP